MSFGSQQRQILFFVAAVLLPSVVLVGLSVRMIRQELELAEKRAADDRRRIASNISQQLLARLERVKSEEASAGAADKQRVRAERYVNAAVALVARIDEGQPVLPWELAGSGAKAEPFLSQPEFAARIRQGEEQEFVKHAYTNAAVLYAEAARVATHSRQTSHARLLQARAQARAGQRDSATTLYRAMLGLSSDVTDEHGIPLALYAATGLIQLGANHGAVLELVQRLSDGRPDRGPAMACMIRDLLESLAQSAPPAIAPTANEALRTARDHIRFLEQSLALQRGFASLGLGKAVDHNAAPIEPVWVFDAERSWLVSVAPSVGDAAPLLLAVEADKILPEVQEAAASGSERLGQPQVIAGWTPGGESLGPNFPGMQVTFSARPQAGLEQNWSIQRGFYLLTLGLVLSVTLFAAYLLWRDVRRELRIAHLRSQFVASVSHELKTPLTAIRMFAETLSLGRVKEPGTQTEYLETIVNESQRLTRLLNNVLDFSKIEQGKKSYRLEPTCLAEIVQAAVRTMQYPLAQQGFHLRVEIQDGLPVVRADADAIEQAILNLLANAMKYSGDSREIGLRLRQQDRDVVIQVTDRGVGIATAEQARIFEKFYRTPSALALRVPGTGLGLTLVQHIARAHGGEVQVESDPGKGSTFSIRIPLENAS
ncbi:MAG: sensor histidine kinase [Verrucomicrobiia bacterium]